MRVSAHIARGIRMMASFRRLQKGSHLSTPVYLAQWPTKAARLNDAKTAVARDVGKSSRLPCKFFPGSKSGSEGGDHAMTTAHDAIMQTAINFV